MTELAEKCLYYRAKHNLNQTAMAERCGITRQIIARVEQSRGVSPLTEAKIRLVVEAE